MRPSPGSPQLSRRELARLAGIATFVAACQPTAGPEPTPAARTATPRPETPSPAAQATPTPTPQPQRPAPPPTLLRGAAFADGRSRDLKRDVSLLIRDGKVAYLGPRDGEPDPAGARVVDAAGATIVPGLVDCHAHFTGLGGANWVARFEDPDAELLARGLPNARACVRMGVLAARDVGGPRKLNLRVRDELKGRVDAPTILAAGTWIARRGRYVSFAVEVSSAQELRDAALAQLDAGTDLVKVAVDDSQGAATFSADELRLMVEAVHARGKTVAAHSQGAGARNAAQAGVDTIEHGFGVDRAAADAMRGRSALVTTLSVLASFRSFADTVGGRWDARAIDGRMEQALAAVRAARDAGVKIATGSDFGGGSVRPGHLAWEVELLVRAGLEPHHALAAATWVGGEVLGVPQAGTVTAGAPADLVLVHGDPLSDAAALWRVWMVFRGGERVA